MSRPALVVTAVGSLVLLSAVFARGAGDAPSIPSPYRGEQQRPIKSLSPQELSDLEAGRGMGLSKVAELNHYPGPRHVLDLSAPLQLTDMQRQKIERIHAHMQEQARQLGRRIIAREAALDGLFMSGGADGAKVRALIEEIERLRGQLRFVHVDAHLSTTRLLSVAQIAEYDRQRGYAGEHPAGHHPH